MSYSQYFLHDVTDMGSSLATLRDYTELQKNIMFLDTYCNPQTRGRSEHRIHIVTDFSCESG